MRIDTRMRRGVRLATVCGLLVPALSAVGNPPPPPNDAPEDAQVIGPATPILVYGTTVLADDSISVTTLPAPADDVDGPDVFYSFTPEEANTYRVHLLPWVKAPLRSSDRRFTVYVMDGGGDFVDGVRAPGSARPLHFDVTLDGGVTYTIGVDYNATTHDNFPFTLMVDTVLAENPDDCDSVMDLPGALPVVVLGDIDAASPDFDFAQSGGRCAVSGGSPTDAPGNDHVFRFTPSVTGDYAIDLIPGFDGVVYVDDTCPPDFNDGCLGAANHSTSGTSGGKHELVVVSLEADVPYYVYVDNGSDSNTTGAYALIIDTAFNYEANEIEPNDAPASATPVSTPLNGGQLVGPLDEDWWRVSGFAGDRIYAWVNNGGSSNSTLDTDLGFYAPDGVTLIEFDDEDGDGADAPIEDLRFIYSTTSPVIAGAQFTESGNHYLRVTDQSDTGTVHRYRLHVGVQPVERQPLSECEPNDDTAAADLTGKHYYAGVIDVQDDVDYYAIEAEVGDRVFIALDGDPERDGTGFDSPNDDPRAFHAKLVVYDPEGDVLISDISDSNSIQSGPDYPAQGGFFIARTAGTHHVAVSAQSSASQVGPEETYHLAVFINDAAPDLSEVTDPVIELTPDHAKDLIEVVATDNQEGDSGICEIDLVANSNVGITDLTWIPGEGIATFKIGLINGNESGFAKLRITDCEGNTSCAIAKIDVSMPSCDGFNFSNRSPRSLHGPIHVPDNDQNGIDGEIEITSSGPITNVEVTLTIETIRPPDIDCFLESPEGTRVELFTDRGSSLEFDIIDATFTDDAEEILPILSSRSPYTGRWLPEDPQGMAQLNGENAQGIWKLNVADDSGGGGGAGGGARLVRWSLDVDATFPGPQSFFGLAGDTQGFDCGIASIELRDPENIELVFPDGFEPGDLEVPFRADLIDPSAKGFGFVVVTDLAENECETPIALNGEPDVTGPANAGETTTELDFGAEVQADVPGGDPTGVVSPVNVPDEVLVGEVEVDLTIDTKDVGRLASILTHAGGFASLINRVGMDERQSVGLTKDNIEITLDDDAPVEDDAHLEPASGSIEFLGLHQPDGRGEFIGDGIDTDDRDNMLFVLAGGQAAGDWELFVGDFRDQGAGSAKSIFRRWAMSIKNPCGQERYFGRAIDLYPGTGICDIEAVGFNLALQADFEPGAEVVDYAVVLDDPSTMGEGSVRITDCAGNETVENLRLLPPAPDQAPPMVDGAVNESDEFVAVATDDGPDDFGIETVELAPFGENLQIVSVNPDPPDGAEQVEVVVGLVDGGANGRGYLRVADRCGLRDYALVHIDAVAPICSGSVGRTKRYVSEDLPAALPDDDDNGVHSSIVVTDAGTISDVDITLDITHGFDDDIDVFMTTPRFMELFTDIGSTGNDFIDTVLDDEADGPIPDSSGEAPFTGRYQPEGGPVLSALDGEATDRTYTLSVADDAANNFGTWNRWAITIESLDFPERYDGRVEDSETFATGVCSIELLPGATNLSLTADDFEPGASIVRYSVELCHPQAGDGVGTVRVTDCAGNVCDTPIALTGDGRKGDMDGSGAVDLDDYPAFYDCFDGPDGTIYDCGNDCRIADFNDDGRVDLRDYAGFQAALGS